MPKKSKRHNSKRAPLKLKYTIAKKAREHRRKQRKQKRLNPHLFNKPKPPAVPVEWFSKEVIDSQRAIELERQDRRDKRREERRRRLEKQRREANISDDVEIREELRKNKLRREQRTRERQSRLELAQEQKNKPEGEQPVVDTTVEVPVEVSKVKEITDDGSKVKYVEPVIQKERDEDDYDFTSFF
ncbi:hypothetical protein PCE1_002847 [Barthelona sp. PCE]